MGGSFFVLLNGIRHYFVKNSFVKTLGKNKKNLTNPLTCQEYYAKMIECYTGIISSNVCKNRQIQVYLYFETRS